MSRLPTSRRRLLELVLIPLALATWGGRCGGNDPWEWEQIWTDEFAGPAGQLPDPEKWKFDTGTDWGNAQLEYDTDRPENVSLDGEGHLAITALKERYRDRNYTSGRITTEGLFEQTRGRFEARIKLPVGQGIWPAFWLLGADIDEVRWPACGEIDIMEYRGQEPRVALGSLHGPGYYGGGAISERYDLPGGEGFNADFHVFGVEWDEDRITWEIDGEQYFTVTSDDLPSGARWVFDHPFYVILNVAVGGHFVGPPNSSTAFPQTMLVDWVRVSELQQ